MFPGPGNPSQKQTHIASQEYFLHSSRFTRLPQDKPSLLNKSDEDLKKPDEKPRPQQAKQIAPHELRGGEKPSSRDLHTNNAYNKSLTKKRKPKKHYPL